jgi:hypothetical protein
MERPPGSRRSQCWCSLARHRRYCGIGDIEEHWFGSVCGVDSLEQARDLDAARHLGLSLLYWL